MAEKKQGGTPQQHAESGKKSHDGSGTSSTQASKHTGHQLTTEEKKKGGETSKK